MCVGGGGGEAVLTLTSWLVKRETSTHVDVCGSANDPGPEMIPILYGKRFRSEYFFLFCFSAFRSKHSSILVRNTRRLGYKSKILVSLEVLMTKRHHF